MLVLFSNFRDGLPQKLTIKKYSGGQNLVTFDWENWKAKLNLDGYDVKKFIGFIDPNLPGIQTHIDFFNSEAPPHAKVKYFYDNHLSRNDSVKSHNAGQHFGSKLVFQRVEVSPNNTILIYSLINIGNLDDYLKGLPASEIHRYTKSQMMLILAYVDHEQGTIGESYDLDVIWGEIRFKSKNFFCTFTDKQDFVAIQYTAVLGDSNENRICVWDIKNRCKHYVINDTPQVNVLHYSHCDKFLFSFKVDYLAYLDQVNDNHLLIYENMNPYLLAKILPEQLSFFQEFVGEQQSQLRLDGADQILAASLDDYKKLNISHADALKIKEYLYKLNVDTEKYNSIKSWKNFLPKIVKIAETVGHPTGETIAKVSFSTNKTHLITISHRNGIYNRVILHDSEEMKSIASLVNRNSEIYYIQKVDFLPGSNLIYMISQFWHSEDNAQPSMGHMKHKGHAGNGKWKHTKFCIEFFNNLTGLKLDDYYESDEPEEMQYYVSAYAQVGVIYILAKNYKKQKHGHFKKFASRDKLAGGLGDLEPASSSLTKIYADFSKSIIRVKDQLLSSKSPEIKEIFRQVNLLSVSCNDEVIATCQKNSRLIRTWNPNIDLIYVFNMSHDSLFLRNPEYENTHNKKEYFAKTTFDRIEIELDDTDPNRRHEISAVALLTDKNSNVILAAADENNVINRWDVNIGKKVKDVNHITRWAQKFKVKWSPDSNSFAVVYISDQWLGGVRGEDSEGDDESKQIVID